MSEEFQKTLIKFDSIKSTLPQDMKWKLEYMAAHVLGRAKPIQQLTQFQQQTVGDIYQLNNQTLKLVFISIVNSFLSPKLYSSFQKQCKIKVYGYMSKWVKAYIDFGTDHIYFNKVSETTKFRLRDLQCYLIEGKPRLQFRYKGMLRAAVKFQQQQSAESILAKIRQLQKNLNKSVSDIEQTKTQIQKPIEGKNTIAEQQSYKLTWVNKNKTVRMHEIEPRIYAQIFIQLQNKCEIKQIIYYLISQKLWNTKIKSQKISTNQLFQQCNFIVERSHKSVSILASQRKTVTKLSITNPQISSIDNPNKSFINCESYSIRNKNPKYIITQEDISTQYVSDTKKAKAVLAELNIMTIIQILSPKLFKIILEASYDGKGHSKNENNRSMINIMFSDIVFLDMKFKQYLRKKQKEKIKNKSKNKKQNQNQNDALLEQIQKIIQNLQDNQTQKQTEFKQQQQLQEQQTDNQRKNQKKWNENKRELEVKSQNFVTISNDSKQAYRDDMFYDLDSSKSQNSSDQNNNNKEKQKQKQQQQQQQLSNNIQNNNTNLISKNIKRETIKRQMFVSQDRIQQALKVLSQKWPTRLGDKVNLDYLRLIKQKIYQISYLRQNFSQQIKTEFDKQPPFYCPSILTKNGRDYQVNQNKQLIFINQELIQGQKDSLKFIVKQVGANIISGKSVMNVSLPVDIFESRSMLQRSAASFGCAPKYLKPIAQSDPITQMKSVVSFLMSVPPLQLIMQKPFNPILGETLQVYVGGIPLYYEQISHHPPVSAYYLKSQQFSMYGNLVAVANVGLNSGYGRNAGVMTIVMKNGTQFQLYFPPTQISGLIYGSRKFGIYERGYVVCKNQRLFAQISISKQSKGLYENKEKQKKLKAGQLIGGIFKVTNEFLNFFASQMSSGKNFSGLKKNNVEQRVSFIEGTWFDNIFIDGKNMTSQILAYPVQYHSARLPSDSNYRLDVMFHRFGDLARSQTQKQILQDIQRNDKKLREKYKKKS